MTGRGQHRRERILIIMDKSHAARVKEAAVEAIETSTKKLTKPIESRIATAVVVALRLIVNRPEGWYDTAFRETLKREVKLVFDRQMTHEELQKVMDTVYAAIPPREDTDELQELRASRLTTRRR